MKCKICGAELKKEGDICTNCYKAYKEEEELKKDVKEVFKVKRKYSIAFEIAKNAWIFVIFILSSLICLTAGGILEELLLILILGAVLGVILFIDKRLAMGTQAVFYEKKVVYTFKFLFINTTKTVKYSDLRDITPFQGFTQKRFGYADLCFYAKGTIPGVNLLNGFQIKNVENASEILNITKEVIGLS